MNYSTSLSLQATIWPKADEKANETELSVNTNEFWPQRNAGTIAAVNMKEQIQD